MLLNALFTGFLPTLTAWKSGLVTLTGAVTEKVARRIEPDAGWLLGIGGEEEGWAYEI